MRNLLVLVLVTLLVACEVKPLPINYGSDACEFCKMTIVDNQHAAQLVTVKGRSYKYDAIECMMNHLNQWDNPPVKHYLVSDYAQPGALTDAEQAHYLYSEAIPSPMGQFLTAFKEQSRRDETLEKVGGEAIDWTSLGERFNWDPQPVGSN